MAIQNPLEAGVIKLVLEFQRASEGLFTFGGNSPMTTSRDKGYYAYSYAKPSKRISQILAVDRELLLLASTFSDQQQRTIKTAKELIASASGRLESAIAVIVHNDPEGNLKMQNWGRSIGLSVLPIFAARMPSTPNDLEKYLANELFSHDPFDLTGPVSDDSTFFGRRNEAQDLARKLQMGQIRSCLGMRKTGKTSIINRVISEVQSHHDCYSIFLDCSRDEIWTQTAEGLMLSIADAVGTVLSDPNRYTIVGASRVKASLAEGTRRLQSAITRAEKPLLIFIDEVDYITPSSPTAPHWAQAFNPFWRNFRAIYQEALRHKQVISVMVGGVSSRWFAVGEINGVENAALLFIPEEYLSPLPKNATIKMIQKISRSSGLIFPDEVAAMIAECCGNIPFWVRKACSFIHRQTEINIRPVTLRVDTIRPIINDFIEKEGSTLAEVAIQHLFRVYPELEPAALASLGPNQKKEVSASITCLRRYGILSEKTPSIPSGQMIQSALSTISKQRETANSPDVTVLLTTTPKDIRAMDRWADDLAVINKDRNLLEKALRQLVLNFIRQDALTNKGSGTIRDRLNACTPPSRKTKLANLQAINLIENLMWHELTSVIMREWKIFGPIFADKVEFEKHRNVINQRMDAHAKDADELDIALYRGSIRWMNDKLVLLN